MSAEREPYTPPAEPIAVSAVQAAEFGPRPTPGTDLGEYASLIP